MSGISGMWKEIAFCQLCTLAKILKQAEKKYYSISSYTKFGFQFPWQARIPMSFTSIVYD
jgi:hypothetical protein